jgi:hypothetical protein
MLDPWSRGGPDRGQPDAAGEHRVHDVVVHLGRQGELLDVAERVEPPVAGQIQPRRRRRMAPEGLDPHYSDSYVPTEVDVLSYGSGDTPQWTTLGRLADRPRAG